MRLTLIAVLLCLLSCTTTVIQPVEKPNLVGTWACSTILEEFTYDLNNNRTIEWPSEVYKNKFKRYDTLIITADTIRHIQLIRTLDSVILSIRDESNPSNIIPGIQAPKDSVLYHDTVSYSNYVTSGDGYNIYFINSKSIMNNEYHVLISNEWGTTDTLPFYTYYVRMLYNQQFNYNFCRSGVTFINTKGQIEQYIYYAVDEGHGYTVPVRYTKVR